MQHKNTNNVIKSRFEGIFELDSGSLLIFHKTTLLIEKQQNYRSWHDSV